MKRRATRFLSASVVVMCIVVGLPTAARAAPNPNDCHSGSEGATITEVGTKVRYTCFCLVSTATGRKYCRWRAVNQATPNARSQVQLGAEWGLWGMLNYGEVAQTDDGQYKSFGEVASFYNGSLSNSPAGWLANATVVRWWNGSAWTNCRDSGFSYSSSAWAWLNTTWSFGAPPCGDGYYATTNYGFVRDGGNWQGNPAGIMSSYIPWFGCLSCRTATTMPPPDAPPPVKIKRPPPPDSARGPATPPAGLVLQGGTAESR